ncbi:MAG: DUF2147 domain-containing protein [Pseudomonadota bacterium]
MLSALALAATALAVAEPPVTPMDAIAGDWVTGDGSAIVRLFACESDMDSLCGHMIWIEDPAWVEDRFLGGEIIANFQFERGAWRKGHLTNPGDGNVYRGSISLEGDGQLKLKGCALRVLCQSEMWRRLESLAGVGAAPEELVMDRLPSAIRAVPSR